MTATKHVTLWCDQRGCSAYLEVSQAATDRKARDIARDEGWRHPDTRKDYCPKHADAQHSQGDAKQPLPVTVTGVHMPGCNPMCRGDDHYLLSGEQSQRWHDTENP